MKKLLSLLLALTMVFGLATPAFAAHIGVSVNNEKIDAGDSVVVTITLEEPIDVSEGATMMQGELHYDGAVLEFVSVEKSDQLSNAAKHAKENKVLFHYLSMDNSAVGFDAGVLVTVTFKALEDIAENHISTFLEFKNAYVQNAQGENVGDLTYDAGVTVLVCKEHTWNDGEVTTAATCTGAGVKTYTCTFEGCGSTRTEEVAALGHSFSNGICTVCGEADPDYVAPTYEPVTVYFSASHDDQYMMGEGGVAALREITVPYFDLALYGLEDFYFQSEDYGSDSGNIGDNNFENAEPYEGKITMLHLFLYATETIYLGVAPENAGQGYLYDNGYMGSNVFDLGGSVGSCFLNYFWDYDMNLNYYLNYEYPLASEGWGATADQILLEDGDIVTLGQFVSYSFYSDSTSIFNYIVADNNAPVQGETVTLTLYCAGPNMGNTDGTAQNLVTYMPDVYYISVDELSDGDVTTWNYLGYADENGQIVLDTTGLEPGQYIVAMPGQYGMEYPDDIVSTPGGVLLTVEENVHVHDYAAAVTDPTCTEGGYTTYTCACGDSYVADETAALGHSYENGTCTVCGEADPDYVPEAAKFNIFLPEGDGYTASFEGEYTGTVEENGTCQFRVEPDVGYRITSVTANGETVTGINRVYTLNNITSDVNIAVMTEAVTLDPVTITMEITKGTSSFYQYGQGEITIPMEVTVPYFDLGLYDFECFYYNPDCYYYVSDGDSNLNGNRGTQTAGTQATAYGVVTTMHVFIWTTEVFHCGLAPEEAGKGYLRTSGKLAAEELGEYTMPTDGIYYTGGVGSTFMYFLDHGSNLNYYLNYEYPLGAEGWGSTADQQALTDGDVLSVHLIEDYSVYSSGFQYLQDQNGNRGEATVTAGDRVELKLYVTTSGGNYTTDVSARDDWEIYCWADEETLTANIEEWPYENFPFVDFSGYCGYPEDWPMSEDGVIYLDTSETEPGVYYLAVGGFIEGGQEYGAAVFTLTVEEGEHVHSYDTVVTEPTCTEGGYTTYTCACGDSYVADETAALGHSYENGTCTICGTVTGVAHNTSTDTSYATVAEALEAALEGQSIILLADCTDGNLMVTTGITLDLNGFDLTASYVVTFDSAQIIDSIGGGSLIISQKNLVLQAGNTMVPVYNGSAYEFSKFGFAVSKDTAHAGDGIKINTMAYPVDMDIVELLKDGGADNNVQIVIRLTWDTADGTGSQEFAFTDQVVSAVYSSNQGTWNNYTKMFAMTITGYEGITNLKANVVVVSGTGVEYVSSTSLSIT